MTTKKEKIPNKEKKDLQEDQLEFAMDQLQKLGEKSLEKAEEVKEDISSEKPAITIEEIEENFEVEIVDIFPHPTKPNRRGTAIINIKVKNLPFEFVFTLANVGFKLRKNIEELRKIKDYNDLKNKIFINWIIMIYRKEEKKELSSSIRFSKDFKLYIEKLLKYEILEYF